MSVTSDNVRDHYEAANGERDLAATIRQMIEAGDGRIDPAQLAAFDQFHVGGLAATKAFDALLDLRPGERALDAGSGLGGPARHMAETFGCHVTGVDLAPSFVAVAQLLAERTGMSEQVAYQVGDLLALPFADASFDVVFTQHVVMNIADRETVYREIARVLRPGGRFGFYDVLAAEGGEPPFYPAPWAATREDSELRDETQTREALAQAGLTVEVWNDVTDKAQGWLAEQRASLGKVSGLAPSLVTVMGPRFGVMAANMARNLAEGRVRLVMAKCRLA